MKIKHFEAKTAFLNGSLQETIFMQQPEGYVISGKEDSVYILKKGIYGLNKQLRPDIASSLSQHNIQPSTADWTEVKRVFRYLKGAKDYELRLGEKNNKTGLIGFANADWAEDGKDRKSNSGYLFKLNGSSISWGCR
ncbi:uncharacterized protein LOC127284346 [Leptopilina boulardi]|uniref:uncharacterized protein LOC127284346 n=1 Tax=Leptopilina boulardi TaxID=63433 RepID=UPI0021F522C7|nr:uncharacterized protein LOC127284346 [Leptopilina boulardi]